MSRGEESFVAWLRRQKGTAGIGDDVAELAARGRLVVTVDQQIEGTHYYPGLDPETLGRRLLRVNLSDLAATGARPRWALLTLGLPEETDPRPLVRGLLAEARRHGVALVGGDVAFSPVLASTLTLIGEKGARDAPLGRDRARPGHRLWLGGPVGESALGCELLVRGASRRGSSVKLPSSFPQKGGPAAAARRAVRRNLLPEAQLELGRWLAALGSRAGAVIDVSDGLAKDLRRVCSASGVGAELDLRLLRGAVAPGHVELAEALGIDPIAVALAGGEDYVLLFTLPARVEPPARFGAVEIGRTTRAKSVLFLDAAGERHPLPHLGWDHLG
ncbi:MAG TPA: thiamine-phosphate kinase [Thermoanaerobaculia bacterium]|nr:thiamine-phosphate kinase [Thermoanaerobaculia bacterium]